MANKMPANNAIAPSTDAVLPRSTESNRQISQPNTIDFATNYNDKRRATILENKNTTISSWDLMELLIDLRGAKRRNSDCCASANRVT